MARTAVTSPVVPYRFLVGRERDPTSSDIYRLLLPTLDPETLARLNAISKANAASLAVTATSTSPSPVAPSPTPPQTPATPHAQSDGETHDEPPLEPPPSDLVNVRELPTAVSGSAVETVVLPASSISDRSSLQSADESRDLPPTTTVADAEADEIWRRLRSDRSTQSSPTPTVELERALALVRTFPPSKILLKE